MGSTRKCIVCAGSGVLWGTPKLSVDGGSLSKGQFDGMGVDSGTGGPLGGGNGPYSEASDRSFGLDVTCWRCVGRGWMPDDKRDEGSVNG